MKAKQLIIIAALLLAAVAPMKAQDWKKEFVKGDELLNTKDRIMLVYTTDFYSCAISTDPYSVVVLCHNSVFDFTTNGYAPLIGFYDTNNALVEKAVVNAYLGNDFHTFSFFDSRGIFGTHWVKKIIEWLESGKGHVRISAKRYGEERINILLPTMKDNIDNVY